jgi:hypothetical protein
VPSHSSVEAARQLGDAGLGPGQLAMGVEIVADLGSAPEAVGSERGQVADRSEHRRRW